MVSMLIVVCKRCNSICLDILIYFCAGHKFYDLCNRLTRLCKNRNSSRRLAQGCGDVGAHCFVSSEVVSD